MSSPARAASAQPFSVRSTSTHPVNKFSAFHSLSPWRSRISVESPMTAILSRGGSVVLVDQVRKRLQVLQRLAPRHPPLPLFLDRRPKTQLQQRIEVRVDGFQYLAEHSVDLVGGHRAQRHPADQIDVADVVERVGDAVQTAVSFEQEPVYALVVFVRLAADERLDAHRMLTDGQDGVRLESALPRQLDDDAGKTAACPFVGGANEAVLLAGVLDELPNSGTQARTPRRIENRRPLRRAVTSGSRWRAW